MADGTLRLTVDISPIYAQDAFTLFGMPDAPVVLARLKQEAAQAEAQRETIEADKPKGGFLSQWLALRCKEPEFWAFIEDKHDIVKGWVDSSEKCNELVKEYLDIESKSEIDNDADALKRFHEMIRLPYANWLTGRR